MCVGVPAPMNATAWMEVRRQLLRSWFFSSCNRFRGSTGVSRPVWQEFLPGKLSCWPKNIYYFLNWKKNINTTKEKGGESMERTTSAWRSIFQSIWFMKTATELVHWKIRHGLKTQWPRSAGNLGCTMKSPPRGTVLVLFVFAAGCPALFQNTAALQRHT